MQAQLLDTVHLDIHASPNRIVEAAQDVLQRHERDEEQASVRLLLTRAGHGGLAVVGLQETLATVNTERVHTLIMHGDVQRRGWRCLDCGQLGEELPPHCPVCRGQVTVVELGEAMVHSVWRSDGFVELIAPEEPLAAYEGVGALLRYK